MGWYSAFGRRLFFALPPEAAHRIAGALLELPLPWARIGGAEDDRRLAVALGGVALGNPVGLAAGFDKGCAHLDHLGSLGFGYVVGGTITHTPRQGNPKPRIVRFPERRSMANAMGLPNPGAIAAARNLAASPRTAPRFVSLADESTVDVVRAFGHIEPYVDAIELNASCPNVSWGRDRDNEAHLDELLRRLRERTSKPIFVKLPPFATDVERDVVLTLAQIARDGGAAGLVCSNTRPVDEPRLAVGRGGLSGADLLGQTLGNVADVRASIGDELPIAASGGIFTTQDALAAMEAGATTVQVYSGLIYRGPGIVGELTRGIAEVLRARDIDVSALLKGANRPA